MKGIFYLSGENTCLASFEVTNLLEAEEIDRDVQILIAEFKKDRFHRLALTHEVSRYYTTCDLDELEDVIGEIPVKGSCCVRVVKIRRPDLKGLELEKRLGRILWKRGCKIDLTNPDTHIRVYLSERCHVGYLIHKTNKKQFLERHPNKRPFSMPCVIPPKIGRAMVNITAGNFVLDPMCGTGTFLIEAGLMGLDFVGVEAYRKIVFGCAKNLKFFGLPANVVRGDARKLPFRDETFDGVVTDFPYQRSTRLFGENLVERALQEIYRVLKPNSRAVLVINRDIDDLIGEFFKVEGKCYQRVHKSLTRRFYVCLKV
ncbi:methyltransferase domain-containing protein [Archaeoglobus sp.]